MPADGGGVHLGWDVAHDVGEVLEYHFMVNALLAGTLVAVMAGLAGWLMILRREAFAGHTLSMMAFPGAGAAALVGVSAAWGYYTFCVAGALAIGRLGGRLGSGDRSAGIAAVQVAALAAGYLFLNLYGGVLSDLESQLFGTFLGVSDARLLGLALLTVAVVAALALLARPLLFASVDPEVAAARAVPVRAVSTAFLLLLGLVIAATSQLTGVLLVFALLVGPPAAAQALTPRPALSLALTLVLGQLVVWLGLGLAYFSPYPAGFFIATVSFSLYVLARAAAAVAPRARRERRPMAAAGEPQGVIA
jgi:zinc/manganese transport system permease protein